MRTRSKARKMISGRLSDALGCLDRKVCTPHHLSDFLRLCYRVFDLCPRREVYRFFQDFQVRGLPLKRIVNSCFACCKISFC